MTARLVSVAFLALLLQAPQFRSGIDVVRFDVAVLDKDRHPIAGLTAQDFHVTENGAPLRIAGFEAVTIPGPSPSVGTAAASAGMETVTNRHEVPGRLLVIVLDRSIANEQPTVTARAIANTAIDALGPNDLAAVVFTSGISLGRPQGLTGSHERLHAAVNSLVMGATPGLIGGGVCMCGDCTLETLATITERLTPITDYRKTILFIGSDLAVSERSVEGSRVECRGVIGSLSHRLLRALDGANVTVHVLDPGGLDTTGPAADNRPVETAGSRMVRQGNLQTLPAYTGGRAILVMNQPEKTVPSLFEMDRTYYELAIERGGANKDGRPHAVKIAVGRADATVLSRNAYYDAGPEPGINVSREPLERALAELIPRTDIPLRMTLAPSHTKNSSVEVTLATPLAKPARADVLIGVFDEFAKEVGSERAKVELLAHNGAEVEWKLHVNPRPGHYEVRVAVQIEDTIGTIIGYVDVAKDVVPPDEPNAKTPPNEARGDVRAAPKSVRKSVVLEALLARAGEHLERYADPSNGLLLEEKYAQRVYDWLVRMRELRSELLILPDAGEGWVEFRDVMEVDGKRVVDGKGRLLQVFSGGEGDPRTLGQRITDEGARFNLNGSVEVKRTLNPMVPLLYLRLLNQPRSEFAFEGSEGGDGDHVTFTERRAPPIIMTAGDQTAVGDFWVDRSTGRVNRAVLRVTSRSSKWTVAATIRVRYKVDPKSGLVVPETMEEEYVVRDARGATVESIDGTARYSNPRQFKAAAEAK